MVREAFTSFTLDLYFILHRFFKVLCLVTFLSLPGFAYNLAFIKHMTLLEKCIYLLYYSSIAFKELLTHWFDKNTTHKREPHKLPAYNASGLGWFHTGSMTQRRVIH